MKASGKKFLLVYTLLFILLCIGVFFWFPLYGRSLVRGGDGYYQHTKALAFFGKWLRDIIYTIFVRHSFSLPTYSLSMGFGADAVTTMHYYVLGDPLNLLAVFVPQAHTAILYECLIFVRMYLSGLVFAYFCRYFGRNDGEAVLAGSILYVFTGYVMFAGIRHPYFINPMIWFPLILIGTEKVRDQGRYALFSVSVCMAAISNFYFFYMIVVFTVLYVLWRCFTIYHRGELNKALVWIGKLMLGAVTGVFISAVLFWPVVRLFLVSSRGGADGSIYAMYKTSYYITLPVGFMTFTGPGYWTHLGYTGIGMDAVLVLFLLNKKHTALKTAFVFLLIMLTVPFGGYMLNGFIYVLNRWTWVVSLITAWILVVIWEDLFTLKRKQIFILCICLALLTTNVLVCAYYAKYNGLAQVLTAWAAAGVMTVSTLKRSKKPQMKKLLTALLCAGVLLNGVFANSERWVGYSREFKTNEEMTRYVTPEEIASGDKRLIDLAHTNFLNTEAEAVSLLEDADVVRYDGHMLTRNASVLTGMHGVQFYWSLANENLDAFLQQMGNREYLGYSYRDLDERTRMMIISGVRYFCTGDNNYLPWGFEKVDAGRNVLDRAWPVYENQNALPLGFTYRNYIPAEEFNSSDAIGREEMLMQAVSLEDTQAVDALGIEKADIRLVSETLPYKMRVGTASEPAKAPSKAAEILENGIRTKKNNVTVTLFFDGPEERETALYFKGLDYADGKVPFSQLGLMKKLWRIRHNTYADEPDEHYLIISAGNGAKEPDCEKELVYYTRMHEWYNGRRDFVVNLDYRSGPRGYIQIRFPYKGVYTWDSLEVISSPMTQVKEQAEALGEDVLEEMDLHPVGKSGLTNLVTGRIRLEEPKILFVSIPYDSGWSAVVNGEKRPILRADNMFMAIPLEAGEHQIELHYVTPGIREGALLTLAGLVLLALLCRRKKSPEPENGLEEKNI